MRLFARETAWVDERPDWTEQDAKHLAHFLNTQTGRKLHQILRCKMQTKIGDAINHVNDKPLTYSLGWCNGIKDTLVDVLTLANANQFSDGVDNEDSDAGRV